MLDMLRSSPELVLEETVRMKVLDDEGEREGLGKLGRLTRLAGRGETGLEASSMSS